MEQLTLQEAAGRLGVSVDTLRRRIKRGEAQGYKAPDGRWYVTVPDAGDTGQPGPADADLRLLVDVLREQLEARTREVQELHLLLAQRALPPGPDRRPRLLDRLFRRKDLQGPGT